MANVTPTITGEGQRLGKAPADFSLNITHAMDPRNAQDETIRQTFLLETPSPKTKIEFKSHVSYRPSHLTNSPAYLASVRRRGAAQIRKLVLELDDYSQSEEFAAWTQGVLAQVKQLLKVLADAEDSRRPRSEANSCEVLRQLRDTLLNDGWREYRKPDVRRLACAALRKLSEADTVTADDALRTGESFLDLGIEPTVGVMNSVWEEGLDVEEEVLD